MCELVQIHPDNPQPRLIQQAVDCLNKGGIIVYPTDSCYAFGCQIGDKKALERLRRIRNLDDKHNFTLMCRNMAEMSNYAMIDNIAYRLIKSLTPGPYTFILQATKEVPRRLLHAKRKTIGIRMPDNKIAMALLEALNEPMLSTTLMLPGEEIPMTDPYEMRDVLEHHVDMVIDGGYCGFEPSTILSLLGDTPEVLRQGKGEAEQVAWS